MRYTTNIRIQLSKDRMQGHGTHTDATAEHKQLRNPINMRYLVCSSHESQDLSVFSFTSQQREPLPTRMQAD